VSTPDEPAHKGSLLGLAVVVGLFAFFLADATPFGLDAVAAFFVAAAGLVVLLLVLAAVSSARRRRHDSLPAPNPLRASAGDRRTAGPQEARRPTQGLASGGPAGVQPLPTPAAHRRTGRGLVTHLQSHASLPGPDADLGSDPPPMQRAEVEIAFSELLIVLGWVVQHGADDSVLTDLRRYMGAPESERQAALDVLLQPERRPRLREHLSRFAELFAEAPEASRASLLNELVRWMEDQ
jgi:hypothetical protein